MILEESSTLARYFLEYQPRLGAGSFSKFQRASKAMNKCEGNVLILGGTGLVGSQVAREIACTLPQQRIVIVALPKKEVDDLLKRLRAEFPEVEFEGAWGDIFLRKDLCKMHRHQVMEDNEKSCTIFQDIFLDKRIAYEESFLVSLIRQYKPDIIVDSVNTATGISYQDIYTTCIKVRGILERMRSGGDFTEPLNSEEIKEVESLLISQSIPQLIRHIQLLHDAMVEVGTRLYLKIGTTGTGGMGFNIPYTHSEDKPSSLLLSKTAIAFAHTGLLFVMARTPNAPIVKEIKPGALIGYRRVDYVPVKKRGENQYLFQSNLQPLEQVLDISVRQDFEITTELMMAGVDTGENGFFTLGEFETITSLGQMEFVTPEEIAQNVVLEIRGSNTGKDIIAAIDGAVMDPSYRAGYLRPQVIEEIRNLEKKHNCPSVALGQLGPPELSKLLYEAYLMKIHYGTLRYVLEHQPAEISGTLHNFIKTDGIRDLITSIGIPILCPDGQRIYRGPKINIPEYRGSYRIPFDSEKLDQWAQKGWVDLRPKNFVIWQERFREMISSASVSCSEGSSAITPRSYLFDEIRIGEVVGWIFNNDPKIKGYRIKGL